MNRDAEMEALERESDRWLFNNPHRYRQLAERMVALAKGASPGARARAYRAQGNAFRIDGKWEEALRAVRRALRAWRRAGDEIEWARTQTTLIAILAQLGQNRQALAASRAGLAVFLRHGLELPAARLLNNTGGIYLYTGQPREALRCFQRARELATKVGDVGLGARTDLNQASALQMLGRHLEALKWCGAALRPATQTGQTLHLARIQVVAADSLFQLGRFGKALRRFAKARTLFERVGAERDVAECDLYICACYVELNRYLPALSRMETFLQQPGRAWFEVARASYYQGVSLARLGRSDQALVALQKARKLFSRHGDQKGARQARMEEAELLLALGSAGEAIRLAVRARREGTQSHTPLESARADLVVAAASLALGRITKAEKHANQAKEISQRARIPGLTFRALHVLGQVAIRRQQFQQAGRVLSYAVRLAEQMRSTVQLEFRKAFLADKAAAYADLVWARLQEGKVAAAHRLMEQAKSRALADNLVTTSTSRSPKAGSAEERLQREMESARHEYQQLTLPTSLAGADGQQGDDAPDRRARLEKRLGALWDEWELRRVGWASTPSTATKDRSHRLKQGEALVEYMVTQGRVIAFGSDRSGLRGWVDLGPEEDVIRSLELLQLNMDATLNLRRSAPLVGLTKNANRLLRDLYDRIWAPLPWLEGVDRVLIVPHGVLHQTPFCALYDGERYLIERLELTLAPSRTVWRQCRDRGREEQAARDLVLGFNPDGQLPFVEAEAVAVSNQLGASVCLGQRASTHLLGTGPYRVLHLAVHGQFRPDNPEFSTLLLADGSLTAADVDGLQLKTSLVTLSACETGLSRVSKGEELTGLITAFLNAGANAALASLWRIDDSATATLMVQFYNSLLAGGSKSAALRHAQISMLYQRVHPLYWAGFSIIGDDGPLPETITTAGGD